MDERIGRIICIVACLLLLATLLWAYIPESIRAINIYYSSGVLNPLLAGGFAIVVIIAFAAASENYISPAFGAGLVLSLSLLTFLTVVGWAVTGRVDVFRAPGWAFPAQRWVLVVISGLIVFGAGWYAWALELLPPDR